MLISAFRTGFVLATYTVAVLLHNGGTGRSARIVKAGGAMRTYTGARSLRHREYQRLACLHISFLKLAWKSDIDITCSYAPDPRGLREDFL